MAAYATVEDIQSRIARELSEEEQVVAQTFLEDAGVMIDGINCDASLDDKKIVSCRMVIRAIGDGTSSGVPVGASQGSVSALGYSQSWTIGGGSTGELYLSRYERRMLGAGNTIGSHSPLEDHCCAEVHHA